jgi:transmembrane sensor
MNPELDPMKQLSEHWARATEREAPTFDMVEGRDRLLTAQRELAGKRARKPSTVWMWIAAATLVGGFAIGFFVRSISTYSFTVDGRLALPGANVVTSTAEQQIQFSEGSIIVAGPASVVAVRDVDGRGAILEMAHGTVNVDIVKHLDARWEIKAGPFNVRVLGTSFQVTWLPDAQHFVVSVKRGAVFVDGPMLEPGRSIVAGSVCTVDWKANHMEMAPIAAGNDAPSSSAQAPRAPLSAQDLGESEPVAPSPSSEALPTETRQRGARASGSGHARASAGWQELERSGQFEKSILEAERIGLESIYDSGDAADLMSLARAGRFVSRQDVSSRALLSCRKRFPGSADSATAAYLLGRNAPSAEAIRWFSTYLAEQPAGVWAREASGRLIEAYRASGDEHAAREAAKRYLLRYPNGPHAAFAKSVVDD